NQDYEGERLPFLQDPTGSSCSQGKLYSDSRCSLLASLKSPSAHGILGIVVSPSLELRGSCSARASSRPVYFRILQSLPVPVDCPPAVVVIEQDDPGSCRSFQEEKRPESWCGPPTRFRLQRLLGPRCVESSGVESAALPISEEGLGEDPRTSCRLAWPKICFPGYAVDWTLQVDSSLGRVFWKVGDGPRDPDNQRQGRRIVTALVLDRIAFSKPRLITQLEQGAEPWRDSSECLLDLCLESRTELEPCVSCPISFASPEVLRVCMLSGHPPQTFPSPRVGSNLQPEAPGYSSSKEGEEGDSSDALLQRASPSRILKTFFSPCQGQAVYWVEGNRKQTDPGLAPGAIPEKAGTILTGSEDSEAGAVIHGAFPLGLNDATSLFSSQKHHCGKGFCRKASLLQHSWSSHSGDNPFLCSVCGRGFRLLSRLLTHQCGKGFSQKFNLIGHQRIHTGELPFLCHECGRRFVKEATLIRHQRTHA
ncbi:hypothetical protein A6R68_12857, partial [Neotoma lepida]